MNTTAQNLLNEATTELLDAVWAEANAMGPNTAQIVKYMKDTRVDDKNPGEAMDHVRELLGPEATRIDVVIKSLDMYTARLRREAAAEAYVNARRLAEAPDGPESTDGAPTFFQQVDAERQRQIDMGYTPEHDDDKGVGHLRRVRDSYPAGSVKRAAMARAITDWHARSNSFDQ